MPAPPSSSLQGTPSRPSSPIALMLSQGNVGGPVELRAPPGAMWLWENSRTISRTWW